jgi:hypothetical protein
MFHVKLFAMLRLNPPPIKLIVTCEAIPDTIAYQQSSRKFQPGYL